METGKFTSNKDGGDGYRDYRKACQTAFDDINTVLAPKPRINKIMATADMGKAIVNKIGTCVGVDAEDNPIWTDPRAGSLKPETIELYSFLVSPEGMTQMGMTAPEPAADSSAVEEQNPEVAAAEAAGQPDPALAQGPKFLAEDQECSGWVNKTGPDPRYKETCEACSRNEACATQMAKPKATAKSKAGPKSKGPCEPKYSRATAFLNALKTGGTREQLAATSNAGYMAKTGKKDNLPEAKFWMANFLRLLEEMDLVQEDNGVITLK